jgi:MFS family permease
MEHEMIVISDVTSQGAVPNIETGSPTQSSSSNAPTKKQIESNNLNRFVENANNIGSGASVAYAVTTFDSDTSSAGVTATMQVANALGSLIGLIAGPLIHLVVRKYYRTGKYKVRVGSERPEENAILQMQSGDILIYRDQEKLRYLVKGVGKKEKVEGEIENDGREGALDAAFFQELHALSLNVTGKEMVLVPDKCKLAFLKSTAKKGHTYSGKTSLNPLYRTFRTLGKFGSQAGIIVSYFFSGEDRNKQRLISYILSNAFAIVAGLFAFPYWLIREKILKIPPNSKHKYDLTALEGWSKYARTAQALGTGVGQAVGGLVIGAAQNATAAATSFSIAFWGGIVGLGSFLLGIIGVPLINWISSKFTRDGKGILTSNSKNGYRNNYTRSGIILGAGIGACLGLLIGNWSFGLVMASTIFSALGSVVGGVVLSTYGHKIHKKMHPLPPNKTEDDEDIENSWDYVSRSSASVFGFIGAAVVCAINPAAALMLAPIGAAIASGIGWCLGLLIMRKARQLPGNETEKKADTLPWTQRITMGANIGSIIGSAIGVAVGFAGFVLAGPAGVILAVSLFGAIGAVVGGIWGALYDKPARKLVFQGLKSLLGIHEAPDQDASRESLLRAPAPNSPSLSSSAKALARLPVALKDTPLHPGSPSLSSVSTRLVPIDLMDAPLHPVSPSVSQGSTQSRRADFSLVKGLSLFNSAHNDATHGKKDDRDLRITIPDSPTSSLSC